MTKTKAFWGAVALVAVTYITLLATVANAGDDSKGTIPVQTNTERCVCSLRPRAKYAVQCTVDTYIKNSAHGDAGAVPTTSNAVLVPAQALYDTPTTGNEACVCALGASADGGCNLFLFRNPAE